MTNSQAIVNRLLEVDDPDDPVAYIKWLSKKAETGPLNEIQFGASIHTSSEDIIRENAAESGIDVDSQAFWDEVERCLAIIESNALQLLRESGLSVQDEGHGRDNERVASVWIDTAEKDRELALLKAVIAWAEGDPPSTTSGTMEHAFGMDASGLSCTQKLYQYTEDAARFIDVTIEFTGTDALVEWSRLNLLEALEDGPSFDPDDPEAFIKRFKPRWTLLSHIKNHHFYFKDETGRVAVADYSMRNQRDPESSEDGLLLLDPQYPISSRRDRGIKYYGIAVNQYYYGIGSSRRQSSITANEIEFNDLWPKIEPLGFRLDVRESTENINDPDDPDDPETFLKHFKGRLVGNLIINNPNGEDIVYSHIDGAELLHYFSVHDMRALYRDVTKREILVGERGAYRYRVQPIWRSSIAREALIKIGVSPEHIKFLENSDAPVWFYFPKRELLSYIRIVWGSRINIREDTDPDDPQTFVKNFIPFTYAVNWEDNHGDSYHTVPLKSLAQALEFARTSSLYNKSRSVWIEKLDMNGLYHKTYIVNKDYEIENACDSGGDYLDSIGEGLENADDDIDHKAYLDATTGWIDTFLNAGMTPDTSEAHTGQFWKRYECHGLNGFNYLVHIGTRAPLFIIVERNDALYGTNAFRRVFEYPDRYTKGMVGDFLALDRIMTRARTATFGGGESFDHKIIELHEKHQRNRKKFLDGKIKEDINLLREVHEGIDDPESFVRNFVDNDLGVTFLIHKSGDNSVYADEPFRNDWIIYSDDKEMPADPERFTMPDEFYLGQKRATRTFEGYLRQHNEQWIAYSKQRKRTPLGTFSTTGEAAYAVYKFNRKQTEAVDNPDDPGMVLTAHTKDFAPDPDEALTLRKHPFGEVEARLKTLGFEPSWIAGRSTLFTEPEVPNFWSKRYPSGNVLFVKLNAETGETLSIRSRKMVIPIRLKPRSMAHISEIVKDVDAAVAQLPRDRTKEQEIDAVLGVLDHHRQWCLNMGESVPVPEPDPDDPADVLKSHEQALLPGELKRLNFSPVERKKEWIYGVEMPRYWAKRYQATDGKTHVLYVYFMSGQQPEVRANNFNFNANAWFQHGREAPTDAPAKSEAHFCAIIRDLDNAMQRSAADSLSPELEHEAIENILKHHRKWFDDTLYYFAKGGELPGRIGPGQPA